MASAYLVPKHYRYPTPFLYTVEWRAEHRKEVLSETLKPEADFTAAA